MYRMMRVWADMRASFWSLPYLILIASIGLGFLLTHLDGTELEQWMKQYPRIFGASAEGARQMLSTIASSMMTVVGTVFSMTLVALALASSQFSSRVLRTFMRSRVTQASIGIFAGIFVYCLIVLRGVHGKDETVFVPVLAVSTAMVLAIIGVAVLIVFIHHIALSIQASTILDNVASETITAIEAIFPDMANAISLDPAQSDAAATLAATLRWVPVVALKNGYLQSIDKEGLLRIACELNATIRVERGIGQFVLAGMPIFSVSDKVAIGGDAIRTMRATLSVSAYRTVEQDPSFGIRQLVDVALKALSPGVNDTTTAIMCLDYLGAVMATIARSTIPSRYWHVDGKLKVVTISPDFASLLGEAFDQIRRSADANVAVIVRMIATLDMLGAVCVGTSRFEDLFKQLDFLEELGDRSISAPHDREFVTGRVAEVRSRLAAACLALPQELRPT